MTASPASRIVSMMAARGQTLAVAESLTGGMLTARLVDVPGASAVVLGGIVAYATPLKHSLLDVSAGLLDEHGPVHPDVAIAMARGVRERLAVDGSVADVGVATTGVAGPDPQGDSPVGLVYVAVADARGALVRELRLAGDRVAIREGAVQAALDGLLDLLGGRE
ncbi:competence/damage-inducible protein cinA [Microcella alkaliphila]|uniref:Competence/damage-inducible protein cinA n=1 Tax=Microcella alkaliphila TaxID=279828 RepID=A0A4Q7TP17_9MICO|nr:CinA family protein [Microcella alkaliphila]RZT62555.1 competence/damage-inducible protein cinA [Microcella alkaliphila]